MRFELSIQRRGLTASIRVDFSHIVRSCGMVKRHGSNRISPLNLDLRLATAAHSCTSGQGRRLSFFSSLALLPTSKDEMTHVL